MENVFSSSPTITNCAFAANSAISTGGGMFNDKSASPTITNCTFTANEAPSGGGIYNSDATATVANCILWGNSATDSPEIYHLHGLLTVSYSDVEGGCPSEVSGVTCGDGNIDENPRFFNAADGNYTLSDASPCRPFKIGHRIFRLRKIHS